ncbi:MAG: DUF4968 domain-containing protein, partial [Bacteroides sp.]|nr:DUF4968 domain-containing protein [Bacteroides sp.]
MKKQLSTILCLSLAILSASAQTVTETKHGVRVDMATNGVPTTEVIVYSPSIIRVVKYADGLPEMPAKKSYSVTLAPTQEGFSVNDKGGVVAVSTDHMTATVDKRTGIVSFSKGDKMLLQETAAGEVNAITEGVDKGQYTIGQTFRLDEDEAIFGFGQRGSKNLNQRGETIKMWNTNGNITIPYFTSVKGYGFYWDNAGRSLFEDTKTETRFTSEVAQGVDYYFLYTDGTQDGVMTAVRQLSGKA